MIHFESYYFDQNSTLVPEVIAIVALLEIIKFKGNEMRLLAS